MPTSDILAVQLSRCVERFRDAEAKAEQKAEFRALLLMLQSEPLTLREEGGRVTVNGAPVDGPAVAPLIHRLALHSIAEISVPQAPLPAEVFELIRALAGQPGIEDVPAKLQAAGTGRVSVTLAPAAVPQRPAPAPPPPPGDPKKLGTEGILRGEPMTDITSPSVRVAGAGDVTHDPAPPTPDSALPTKGKRVTGTALPKPAGTEAAAAPAPPSAGPPRAPAAPPPPAPPAEAPPARPAAEAPIPPPPPVPPLGDPPGPTAPAAGKPKGTVALLQELEADPESPNVGDVVATLGRQAEEALGAARPERALTITAALVRLEQRVPEGSARRNYGIALRRLYSKQLLRAIAQLLTVPKYEADAIIAMQRGGADAVEILIEQLVAAPAINERRAIFDALRHVSAGREQLIPLLKHDKWYVIRNVAELIGELGMDEAVPMLAKCITHEDERVRKAVALALAKIGTASTKEPLRRALKDKSPEVRVQVAVGVGGRRTSGLAMPLVVALDEEEDETVRRELILALGRIGSPDAVQALIKIAQPSGRIFGRKPTVLRLAAVDGLRLAGTAPALGTLEGLSDDGDKQVRASAQAAVKDLKTKKK